MNKLFLLVDDDMDDADIFEYALEKLKMPVDFYYADSESALFEYLETQKKQLPDYIFMDLNLPPITGIDCLRKLKSKDVFKNIPVIMYSTTASEKDKKLAHDLGAADFMTKPTDINELAQNLYNIIHNGIQKH